MELTKAQQKAIDSLRKAREKRWKLREISEATGVSASHLSGILSGGWPFSDQVAEKVIAGCKTLKM